MDQTRVQIPQGLPGSTSDKIAKLARLITNSVDQPYSAKLTNKVLQGQLDAKKRMPMPVTSLSPQVQYSTQGISLRGPVE